MPVRGASAERDSISHNATRFLDRFRLLGEETSQLHMSSEGVWMEKKYCENLKHDANTSGS